MNTTELTYAEAACAALREAMHADPSVVALGEDLGRGGIFGQYRGLPQEFGAARIIDTPISEANILGAGVGMALAGLRPVCEMRVVDFALCAMDEIINQAAKNRFMFGGQGRVPLVMRMPIGIWSASAAQHSQSFESWFAHVPGLVVLCPATPHDNYALLKSALQSGDPVIYMEHKELWGSKALVDTAEAAPIGKAKIEREGSDVTIVTWSRGVQYALDAAKTISQSGSSGISVEVVNLRSIWPWDRDAVLQSVAKTKRLLVAHESIQAAGFGAEVAASVAEAMPGVRVKRLGAPRIPVGYAQVLENESRLSAAKIVDALGVLTGS